MLIFLFHLLIKVQLLLELQSLLTAVLCLKVTCVIISPTPSLSSASVSGLNSGSLSPKRCQETSSLLTGTQTIQSSFSQTGNSKMSAIIAKVQHRKDCDDGWIPFNKSCYLVVKETKVFNHAERNCVIHAAHLISIESEEENKKIVSLVQNYIGKPGVVRIWLGMERLTSDSSLHWVDNKPINFVNWAPGEPDQTGACVQMIQKGWWEDSSCLQNLSYICKKDSQAGEPYTRATELGILIGIPMACSVIMLTVVAVLFVKSVFESEGTYFAYGKTRDKDKLHSCLVTLTTSIAHVGAVGYVNQGGDFNRASFSHPPSEHSLPGVQASELSRADSIVEAPEITITPETPEPSRRLDVNEVVVASSSSINQDRFQSVTSLENLVSKRYIKPKTRKLRSLIKSGAVVSPPGAAGKYIKKEDKFEFYEV